MNIKISNIIVSLSAIALFACNHNFAYNVAGPDGKPNWVTMHCKSPATCWRYAGTACPHGYQVKIGSIELDHDVLVQCNGKPHQLCGGDWELHDCQGHSRWVEERMACEPC